MENQLGDLGNIVGQYNITSTINACDFETGYIECAVNDPRVEMYYKKVGGTLETPIVGGAITVPTETGRHEIFVSVAYINGNRSDIKKVGEFSRLDNNTAYNRNVAITIQEGTATLNSIPYISGTTIGDNNIYTLIVTDPLANQTTYNFTLNSTPYNYMNRKLTGVMPNTKIIDFIGNVNISQGETIKVFNSNNVEITGDDTVIGTNMTMKIFAGTTVVSTNTIIIYGDVTGDGDINLNDLASIRDCILEINPFTDTYALAADLYGEHDITLNDLVGVMVYISEAGSINQRKN